MDRLERLAGHLASSELPRPALTSNVCAASGPSDDDIVIVQALRTPIGRAKRGQFRDTHPTELLSAVLGAVCESVNLSKSKVEDIVVGNVLTPGAFATQGRMAQFLAGFPETTSFHTVNRQCSSGLQAFAEVASAIQSGFYEIGIAAGVESMSTADMMGSVGPLNNRIFLNANAKACVMPMGITSEAVAKTFNVSRAEQDSMAADSHRKALRAMAEGRFASEIVPVQTYTVDPKSKVKTPVTVTQDDGPREGTSTASLSKLRGAFLKGGTTTAGNSSQVSDGAAAVLVMKRRVAKSLGLPILGTFLSFAVKGVPPTVMGIGPAVAIPAALEKAGLSVGDIDVFEINEAFASQACYCVKKLGIPMAKVNPNGGAIALGHPLGCTGARQIATLMAELKRTGGSHGVVSMCIGTGMGAAAVFRRE